MKSIPVILSVLILSITSCKNKGNAPEGSNGADTLSGIPAQSTDTSTTYLPVADLLRNDIKQIDAYAGGILKKTTRNGKQDSAFVKPAELHKATEAFFAPELETANLRKAFKESSFLDESTGFLQFIYTPKIAETAIRNLIVYVDPNKTSNNITRIYMEKEVSEGNAVVQQKLTWSFGKYFYAITLRQAGEGTPVSTVEKYIWDPASYAE